MEKIGGENDLRWNGFSRVGCMPELAKADSTTSSALTVDFLKSFADLDRHFPIASSAPWTDETHNLYIRSLETSFVHQMHASINVCSLSSRPNNISKRNSTVNRSVYTRQRSKTLSSEISWSRDPQEQELCEVSDQNFVE